MTSPPSDDILNYAEVFTRDPKQSRYGIASLISGAFAVFLHIGNTVLWYSEILPRWRARDWTEAMYTNPSTYGIYHLLVECAGFLGIATLSLLAVAFTLGIIGILQKSRSRVAAIIGLTLVAVPLAMFLFKPLLIR